MALLCHIPTALPMRSPSKPVFAVACLYSLVACGGGGGGGVTTDDGSGATLSAPVLDGSILYVDANASGQVDGGDQLIIRFDQAVALDGATSSDFELLVAGDSFGSGASVSAGESAELVTITLGSGAALRVHGDFAATTRSSGRPSGLQLSSSGTTGSVRATSNGRAAASGSSFDLVPAFFSRGSTFGPWEVQALATGDLNRDGNLDLVVANGDSEANRVLLGNGDGTFDQSGQALGNADSMDVVLGDVDGDGDADAIFANHGNGQDESAVWLNDGSGSFTLLASFGEGRATSLALGDLDHDGDLDLLEGNSGPNRVWFWDRASSTFLDSGQRIGSGSTRSIAVADLDCDGDADLIVAGRDPAWGWWNDGFGNFNSGQRLANAATDVVVVADVNGDHRPDVLAGNANRQANEVWYLDRQLNLADSGLRLGDATTTDLVLGDFDNDGDLDCAAGNEGELSRVWLNSLGNGGGALTYTAAQDAGDGETSALLAADFDRDGSVDLVEGEEPLAQAAEVMFGLGDGSFHATTSDLGSFPTTALLAGDFDRNGYSEVVQAQSSLAMPSGATTIWTAQAGSRTFTSVELQAENTHALAAADIDGDGDLDLFRGNDGLPASGLWRNDGAGLLLKDAAVLFGNAGVSAACFADFNGDGDMDLAVAYAADGVRIFDNQAGLYSETAHLLAGSNVAAIAVGDLNQDGAADLVVGRSTGAELYLGDGSGAFGTALTTLGVSAVTAMTLADLDGDGALDIITGHAATDAQVWRNDGTATFTVGPTFSAGDCTAVLALDLNCDGRLDLVFADRALGGANRVWLRD